MFSIAIMQLITYPINCFKYISIERFIKVMLHEWTSHYRQM